MKTQIEQISVKNFRRYKDLKLSNLQRLNVFLGANGFGKTTLFKVFNFLSVCLHVDSIIKPSKEIKRIIPDWQQRYCNKLRFAEIITPYLSLESDKKLASSNRSASFHVLLDTLSALSVRTN